MNFCRLPELEQRFKIKPCEHDPMIVALKLDASEVCAASDFRWCFGETSFAISRHWRLFSLWTHSNHEKSGSSWVIRDNKRWNEVWKVSISLSSRATRLALNWVKSRFVLRRFMNLNAKIAVSQLTKTLLIGTVAERSRKAAQTSSGSSSHDESFKSRRVTTETAP